MVKRGLLSSIKNAEEFLSKFDCNAKTFKEKLKQIKCNYRINIYSDDDFISQGSKMFAGNVDSFSFLNEYGKTLFYGKEIKKKAISSHFFQLATHSVCNGMRKKI